MGGLVLHGQNQFGRWKKHIIALLLFVFALQPLFPITLAYAQEQTAKDKASTTIPKNSPSPLPVTPIKDKPSAEASDKVQGSTDQFISKVQGGDNSEKLTGAERQNKISPHELIEKRNANSTVRVNSDGTYTKTVYASPHFYKNGSAWQQIDTNASEDANVADSTNILGKAFGKIKTQFTDVKSYKVTGNKWQARFAQSNDGVGMVRLQENGHTISLSPQNANDVEPVISKDATGRQSIKYKNLWDGITVTYQVESNQLKEFVALENSSVRNTYSFAVEGTKLVPDSTDLGGFKLEGALANEFKIAPLSITLNERGVISEKVAKQDFANGKLTVSVDENWLKNIPKANFPVVIDPSFTNYLEVGGVGNYTAYKSDGYVCSQANCYVNAGVLNDSGYWKAWRSVFFVNYSQLQTPGSILSNANLHLTQIPYDPNNYHGVYTTQTFYASHASCGGFNCVDNNLPYGQASFNSSGDIDVTGIYQGLISRADWNGSLMVLGSESPANTLKMLDSYNSYVTFTYSITPAAPAVITPSNNQVFIDPQVSFKLGAVNNPGGTAPVTYNYKISSASNGTGTVIYSGNINSTQWTVPDGVLQDGTTYYFSATASATDSSNVTTTSPSSSVVAFRIDSRNGKDTTQSSEDLGPVKVDLATGNLSTSASTHATKALGGTIGLSLDYNSPLRSRAGLVGEYWNVGSGATLSIPSSAANLSRIDQTVDFDWASGSPSGGQINNDWFEARWSGYFTAPTAGSYYFGGANDDDMAIYVNNSQMYHSTCGTGTCYGSAITLSAGQVVPIRVEFLEGTGNANAHLYVKGAVSEQVIPKQWLQTGVRPVQQQQGLTGHYYNDDGTHNLNSTSKVQFLSRTDPLLSFNWGTSSPVPGGATDFMARWSGYVTIPTTGTYQFGTLADDGSRITVNGSSVMDNWTGTCCSLVYGTGTSLTAGTYPITVDMYDSGGAAQMNLYVKSTISGVTSEQIVPSSWLSPNAQVLPNGWKLGLNSTGDLSYDHMVANQNGAILTDSSGDTHEYTWTGLPGATSGGYKPPVNEGGNLIRNNDGTFTLQDTDGKVYQFDTEGTLKSVSTITDDLHPSALQYTYSGSPAKLTQVTDGVDNNRWMKVYYSGDSNCGTSPSGFDASAPTNMICAAITNDNRATYFYYVSGSLARIMKPGNELTDYQYDTLGRVSGVRTSTANDAIIYGIRANDISTVSQISYDAIGRVISVTSPDPSASANKQLTQNLEYLPGTGDGTNGTTLGITKEHINGATEPNGFTRSIGYDNLYRTVADTSIRNQTTINTWDTTKDLLLSSTDPAGQMSTTIFDDNDRPIKKFGPAPSTWYDTNRTPLSTYVSQVPEQDTGYDENIQGLAMTYYNFDTTSMSMTGTPIGHSTGFISRPSGDLWSFFNSVGDNIVGNVPVASNWGISMTGSMRLPQNGTYNFWINSSGGVRMWLDDQLVIDDWTNGIGRNHGSYAFDNIANAPHRVRIQYFHIGTGDGTFGLYPNGPGIPDGNSSGQYLSPDYNLVTSTTTKDSNYGDTKTTYNYGSTPEYGLLQSNTIDPSGLNLTTAYAYETPGSGSYLRQSSETLPGGATTNYAYYGATTTADNPCTTTVTEAFRQGGMLQIQSDPNSNSVSGGLQVKHELIYDDAGNVVAKRYSTTNASENWECLYYDTRGRITEDDIPSYGGYPFAIQKTYNYAVNGNPLTQSATDSSSGTVTSTTDLLGRTVSYIDAKGITSTTTYDASGKVLTQAGPLLTLSYAYNNYNELSTINTGVGSTLATITYDTYGRMASTLYPNNMSGLNSITRDSLGNVTALNWQTFYGNIVSDTATRSQSGKIMAETAVLNNSSQPTWNYTYDKASRLTLATQGSSSYAYGFGIEDTSTCNSVYGNNPNAGKSSNRTSMTINGSTTYYCYDGADRLQKTSDPYFKNAAYMNRGDVQAYTWGSSSTQQVQFTNDGANRTMQVKSGYTNVTYSYDANDRVVKRADSVSGNTSYYGYASDNSSPDYLANSSGNVVEQYVQLPGGALFTYRPGSTGAAIRTYSIPDLKGDIIATIDGSSNITSTYSYDPFGNWPTSEPANTATGASYGWKGQYQKLEENTQYYNPIIMGARVYMSYIGRFNTADPIHGGNANAYIYPQDPINGSDLDGMFSIGGLLKTIANVFTKKSTPKPAPKPTVTAKQSSLATGSTVGAASVSARAASSAISPQQTINFNSFKPDVKIGGPQTDQTSQAMASGCFYGCISIGFAYDGSGLPHFTGSLTIGNQFGLGISFTGGQGLVNTGKSKELDCSVGPISGSRSVQSGNTSYQSGVNFPMAKIGCGAGYSYTW